MSRPGYDHLRGIADRTFAALALLLLLPVMAVVTAVVAVTLGRPVLFRQARTGLRGKPFVLVKFRSMRNMDRSRDLVDDAARLTPVGRFLRATNLDELPSFWNVLRGQMALIGPRPMLLAYTDRYTPWQARRHEVRPGITGLAQVRGRNALSWEQKFDLDVWYVDHRSLALDALILSQTVVTVLRGTGVCAPGCATMPEFQGASAARDQAR
jgi:lipopolysaccharide/colanic/teichoic acid biosynthesis glycosyltransferase